MKSLAPGLRELARIFGRQAKRLQLILERRKLARLESALGLLGWQQADYDSGTQRHVDRVTHFEREQVRLTNESAAIGIEIQEFERRRGTAERELAEAVASALEREQPSAANVEALEALAAARRRECKQIEGRFSLLDTELAIAEEEYRSLVAPEKPTGDVRSRLLRCRRRLLAIPEEKAEWVGKLQQTAAERDAMEALLAALKEARVRFEKQDQEWADEIATRQRAKRKLEKESESLEKEKSAPYREIGRALADENISPLNQPEALTAVLTQREKIAGIEAAIASSKAESESERRGKAGKVHLLSGGLIVQGAVALLAIGGQ